jgi:hypothetical protein
MRPPEHRGSPPTGGGFRHRMREFDRFRAVGRVPREQSGAQRQELPMVSDGCVLLQNGQSCGVGGQSSKMDQPAGIGAEFEPMQSVLGPQAPKTSCRVTISLSTRPKPHMSYDGSRVSNGWRARCS